ncbi:hypothetical protein E4U57_007654 [Claviceps arundinis]|uniref:Uncharacterized protein n=1 Tax=Claviceps arundinis TaxID=1623583 RepID=A0ABQ7PIQ8_9HYPO|nr:hypothetical protein E4U57_007654 [Claviceps arundinis]
MSLCICINILRTATMQDRGIQECKETPLSLTMKNSAYTLLVSPTPSSKILEYVLQEQIDHTGPKGSPNQPAKCFEYVGVLGSDEMTGLWILNIHKK